MTEYDRTVADVGENALVERIFHILRVPQRGDRGAAGDVLVGPGDDAAVLACRGNVVLTTDSQHEDVHFRRDWISAEMLGRRSIAVNASDLGAMGARPTSFLVALALPADTLLAWVEELAAGMRQGAERVGAVIVGGDVAAVPGKVSINVTAVGECADVSEAVRRDGASPGDRIYVTGWPGRAAAGRQLLLAGQRLEDDRSRDPRGARSPVTGNEAAATVPPADAAVQACLRAFLDPTPPVSFAGEVARRRHVGAMMDISDGLGIDLARMCRASNTSAVLRAATLLDDSVLRRLAAGFGIDARACLLGGGDDYELLCAVSEADEAGFRAAAASSGVEARRIGRFAGGEAQVTLEIDGSQVLLTESGWDHFTK